MVFFISTNYKSKYQSLYARTSRVAIQFLTINYIKFTLYHIVKVVEVKKASTQMKIGKVTGPDGIPIEAWKYLGEIG